MSLSDPLGDMLARIKNGQLRKKESVVMPASRFRGNVLDVLHREGYIRGFKKVEIENNKNEFEIELKYVDGEPVIKNKSSFLSNIIVGAIVLIGFFPGSNLLPGLAPLPISFLSPYL